MKRILGMLLLAASASAAFAQSPAPSSRVIAAEPQNCPAETTANPYYAVEAGKLARRGWICEPRLNARS